ncbi:MAG: gliding motility-associated ABC transporter ATP-binding subunit GldA [Bacteroidota bacterium]
MSVQVQDLTKIYGSQRAIDQVSFEAKGGEVLGFLGPNGAGKTTTMKIVTCFVPQSSGRASVCGYDVVQSPMEVRQLIGYLPEHNPLYKDMYVREYLSFVAGLHKVPKVKHRVAEMIERTGLEREQNKLIGALSKGYRQRVGLAQAMLHDPKVLILDEPTSGLDPNQLVDIRQLIKQLGQEKTVIFSTHIMQEVQALCDRVVIINRGQIVANDSIEALRAKVAGETIVNIGFKEKVQAKLLEAVAGVQSVKALDGNRWQIIASGEQDVRENLFKLAVQSNLTLLEMHQEVSSVEDVFQKFTK